MKLNELDPRAQQRAYENWARDEPSYDWWDSIYENAIADGKERGFEIQKINFTGFCSQGDGACWQGYILLPEFLDWAERQMPLLLSLHQINLIRAAAENELCENSIKVTADGRYCHEGTMRLLYGFGVDYSDPDEFLDTGFFAGMSQYDFYELIAPHQDEASNILLEAARDFAREIYKNLEEEYEYLTSEEYFREMAEINEWEFTEEGEME